MVAIGVVALWLGASRFVAGASDLAARIGVPPLVVGLTVVALGTSAPEFAVTVGAALGGRADISVANVVGSNVINLGVVLGGSALVGALPTPGPLVRRDGPILVGATLLVTGLVADLSLTRVEGVLLTASLVGYLGVVAYRGFAGPYLAIDAPVPDATPAREGVRVVVGLVPVVVGAELLVGGAVGIASRAGISDWLIGETVVALGTSAPEIVASAAAIHQGRVDVSVGNVLGSCSINLLGVAAALRPLTIAPAAIRATVWLSAVTALAVVLAATRGQVSRREGIILFIAGVADWLALVLFG
jgi:cation:H+ antiporter